MGNNDSAMTDRSRVVLPSAQRMYWAASRWRDLSLIDDRSLFSGEPVNSEAASQELMEAFVDHPDERAGSFYEKLESQLATVSAEAIQLAAELVFVYYLIVSTKAAKAETKRDQVRMVLAFRDTGTSDLPDDLAAALAGGVANPGTAYNTYRWKMFGYLVRFVQAVMHVPRAERAALFADWDAFQQFIGTLDDQSVWTQRYALEHLLFPDRSPAVVSRDDRRKISAAFADRTGGQLDVVDLVHQLEPSTVYGDRAHVNFYRTPYREQWQKPNPKMAVYISWARRFLDRLDDSRAAWFARSERAAEAIASARNTGDITAPVRKSLAGDEAATAFVAWAQGHDGEARHALAAFTDYRNAEAIDRFLERVPEGILTTEADQLAIASVFLMSHGAQEFPLWPAATASVTNRLTDGYPPQQSATVGEKYVLYLERVDVIRSGLGSPQRPWGTRLDAAVLADLLVRVDRLDGWEDGDWNTFEAWRAGKAVALTKTSATVPATSVTSQVKAPVATASSSPVTLEALASLLFMDEDGRAWLEETVDLLEHKRQLIIQGPPGTGKTYLARKLAEFLAGDPERVMLTQFHPGTSYEDFVQGLRPDPENPTSFRVVDGPLLRIAEEARAHPEDTYVLLVDEINRGNVPAVFGELYYLLEYRDQAVTLTYGQGFSLPGNIFLIGTMNTADRSITVLDSALRRRFYVRDLRPGETPVDGMLRNHLAQHDTELEWLAELLDRANGIIKDKDQHVGPSHFMGAQMDEPRARRAWDYTVMPTLREVFYRRPELLDQLEFATLKAAVTHTVGDAAAD
ncbi:McrB family protein [Kocuria turfanensis]|uniref:McrB family protein n=1 Tax=Kocuria turfanensis TaxID=388357 RepID=UPI004035C3FA